MRALKYISIALGIILLFYVAEQGKKEKFLGLHGQTMGTFYNIKIRTDKNINQSELKQKIEQELAKINQQMSVFIKDSEINKINALPPQNKISLSPEMGTVLCSAQKIYNQTQGAFDPTVEPLIELWGFGKERNKPIPSNEEIRQALAKVGLKYVKIKTDGTELIKQKQDLSLNLSAIAKGYGVDRLAQILQQEGINNFIVEIGGEIKTSGTKTNTGEDWNIALDVPTSTEGIVLNLNGNAVATSGNYRNFYKNKDKIYGHTISPQTGYPAENPLISATVISPNCMEADAYATALMVMGWNEGKNFAQTQNLAIILLKQGEENKIESYISPKAYKYIKGQPHD